jgi:hypothetical protein
MAMLVGCSQQKEEEQYNSKQACYNDDYSQPAVLLIVSSSLTQRRECSIGTYNRSCNELSAVQ